MRVIEWIGIGAFILLALLVLLFARREVIVHSGGTIDMSIRLNTFVAERGWSPGLGRFVGDELRFYRIFSFSIRPRRVLHRTGLVVQVRRTPEGAERLALPEGWIVLRCAGTAAPATPVEIALAEPALTGFLSWLEAAPPGAVRKR